MDGIDHANGAAPTAHDQRLCGHRVVGVPHSFEQITSGDSGGREEAVVAPHQIVETQHLLEVKSFGGGSSHLLIVPGIEPTLKIATHGLEGRGGNNTLGRSANTEQDVDPGVGPGARNGTGDVPVADQIDPGAGVTDLVDDALVAGPIKHHRRDVSDVAALGLGQRTNVLLDWEANVDHTVSGRTDGKLLHVDERARIEHCASLGNRDHGNGATLTFAGESRSIDRIDSDVSHRRTTVANRLAVVEHGGFVLLALADDHEAVHLDASKDMTHGINGRLIGTVLVAPAHPASGSHGSRLCGAYEFESQVALWFQPFIAHLVHGIYNRQLAPDGKSGREILLFPNPVDGSTVVIMAGETVSLEEQKHYYRERAAEYDDWWQRRGRYDKGPEFQKAWRDEAAEVVAGLDRFAPVGRVLEIAGGTGNWTQELARHADHLTVIDQSTESLDINRRKLETQGLAERVDHQVADVFGYAPSSSYDAVFFSFWQSHVPDDRFEEFWAMVDRALAPGGRVFLLDNAHPVLGETVHEAPIDVHTESGSSQQGTIDLLDGTAIRTLADGRQFQIVKRYWRPDDYVPRMAELGWQADAHETEHFFFWATVQRRS